MTVSSLPSMNFTAFGAASAFSSSSRIFRNIQIVALAVHLNNQSDVSSQSDSHESGLQLKPDPRVPNGSRFPLRYEARKELRPA